MIRRASRIARYKIFSRGDIMKDKNGFSVLEMFVVAIILSLVALLIVPQFSQAARESRTGKLCKELQRIRSYINIYKVQHENNLPGSGELGFVEAMASQTSCLGSKYTSDMANNGDLSYGPYILRMPENSFNGLNTVDVGGCVGDGSDGWHFDPKTGAFMADDSVDSSRL